MSNLLTKNVLKLNTNFEIQTIKNIIVNASTTSAKSTSAAAVKSKYELKNKIGEKSEVIFKREDKYGY
jgi:hypothetical protein